MIQLLSTIGSGSLAFMTGHAAMYSGGSVGKALYCAAIFGWCVAFNVASLFIERELRR